nr:DEAD/DEAH box helicase [Bradyrhizobium sp. Bra64]
MINDILRVAGLYPYIENETRWTNLLAADAMRLPALEDITLHLEQMKVFGLLISGKSLILSAPTSFGKSLLVDALISSKRPPCVVIVVPTLALLDEYRKRLRRRFPDYNIITHDYQSPAGQLNIYVGTQERIATREITERVNLFVIDEFYKLDLDRGDNRALALNSVMAQYAKAADQIYLLGPSIDEITPNTLFPKAVEFYSTTFSPVAADIVDYTANGPNIDELIEVIEETKGEPTLIYVRSPQSAARLATQIIERLSDPIGDLDQLGDWLADSFHEKWILANSIRKGIGIHHGRVPRSIGQYEINLFNKSKIPILICTSTLIEGVNTAAKNVIIYDKYISKKKLDRFTYDNIKGRAGRMFQHYIGRIFLFNPPPEPSTLGIDIPLFSGFEHASDEMIMHVPIDSLSPRAKGKRELLLRTSSLPASLLQKWSRFGIEQLNSLRDEVESRLSAKDDSFVWRGFGRYEEIEAAFLLAWNNLEFEKHGMFSAEQAAYFSNSLRSAGNLSTFFARFVRSEGLAAQEPIDRCFNFLRGAEFTFPEVLKAVEDVVNSVREDLVDYSFFARALQNWFLPGNLRTLEEFGIPLPLIQKLNRRLPEENPDEALEVVRQMASNGDADLSPLEIDILNTNLS